MTSEPLKLRAEGVEDVTVISACLQDAVLTVGDMAYLPGERRFAFMANRFVWEEKRAEGESCHRVRTGVHFDDVLDVSSMGIPQKVKSKVLELLAVEAIPGEDASATIDFLFAGGGVLRLNVECINGLMTDVSAPWPARCKPCHEALELDLSGQSHTGS